MGRLTPDGSATEFSVDNNTRTQLYNIMNGPDGNLWMLAIQTPNGTSDDQLVVIRVAPDGTSTVFGAFLPHSGEDFVSNVSPIAVGSDGNLWYTASFYSQFPLTGGGNIVGRISPSGEVTNFNVGLIDIAQFGIGGGITAGPDGSLWLAIGDGIHSETPGVRKFSVDGQLSDVIPGSHALSEMVTDANGNVWGLVGSGPSGSIIERITSDGTASDFPLPVRDPTPRGPELDPSRMTITAGPDGNIWFSDPFANQIGNIAPDGTITEYAVPTPDSFPAGITTGPDGNIWFTEMGSGQIGEFVLNDAGQASESARTASIAAMEAVFAGAPQESLQPVVAQQLTMAAAATGGVGKALPPPSDRSAVPELSILPHQHKPDRAEAADPAVVGNVMMEKLL